MSGHRDANGFWVADPQPGYYDDNGRWRPGRAVGDYDAQGRWTAMGPGGPHGPDTPRQVYSRWAGAPMDVRARENWLDQRIRRAVTSGGLARAEGNRAIRTLNDIRRQEMAIRRHNGRLNSVDEARIQARLDGLFDSIRWPREPDRRPR